MAILTRVMIGYLENQYFLVKMNIIIIYSAFRYFKNTDESAVFLSLL